MAPGTHGHAGTGSPSSTGDPANGTGHQHDQHGPHDQHGKGQTGAKHGVTASGLDVSSDVVPALRSAFFNALVKVDRQIELAGNDLRLTAWAKDPISQDATESFNNRAVDPGSAMDMLRAYRTELEAAVGALDAVSHQYDVMEQDNTVAVSQQPGGDA